jgi:hypothetical protein
MAMRYSFITANSRMFRFKMAGSSHHGGRKLVSTRSNPQLGPLIPLLNQIHEESEEGANSPAADIVDPARSSTGKQLIQPGAVQAKQLILLPGAVQVNS